MIANFYTLASFSFRESWRALFVAAPLPPSMDSVALMLALLAAPLRLPLVLTPPAPAVPSLPLGSVNALRT